MWPVPQPSTDPITATTSPHSDHACHYLFITNDDLIRQLLHTMFSNFIGYFLVSQVSRGSKSGLNQPFGYRFGIFGLVFGNVEYDNLHR